MKQTLERIVSAFRRKQPAAGPTEGENVNLSRRQFTFKTMPKAAVVAAATLFFQETLFAETPDERQLRDYRKRMFGRWPGFRDGLLEKLDYNLYAKDRGMLQDAVNEAVKFMQDQGIRNLYSHAYGEKADQRWKKDYQKVVRFLLGAISVPDYHLHRQMRGALQRDGILDFAKHQQSINQGLDQLIAQYDETPKPLKLAMGYALDHAPDAADALQALFLLTAPLEKQTYHEIDKQRKKIMDEAEEALENAKNIEEALRTNNHVKTAHQTKELIGKLNSLFGQLLDLQENALRYARQMTGMGHQLGVIYPFEDLTPFIVFDYVAAEYDALAFQNWRTTLQQKADAAQR